MNERGKGWGRMNTKLAAGAFIVLPLAFLAVVSFFWTPHPYTEVSIAKRLQPFSALHLLGTDQFGRDMLSLLMVGARNSILISALAGAIGLLVGVPAGVMAARHRGWDSWATPGASFIFAFPALLTAVILAALFGPGAFNAAIAIGVFNIPVFLRVTRAASLSVWHADYIDASRALGRSEPSIAASHLLPNIAHVLIAQLTIQLAMGILAEAGLSYLGLGTRPPEPTWGRMLAEAQTFHSMQASLAVLPGLAVTFAVLGFNLLGDGLRDSLNPKSRRRV